MDPNPKQPLEYDRTIQPAVTRGQFRLLLLLVLIQIVMTAQSTYAPGVAKWVESAWASRQAARAAEAQRRHVAAIESQCMAFTHPAHQVAWEEDPRLAAALLNGAGTYHALAAFDSLHGPASDLIGTGAALSVPAALREVVLDAAKANDSGLVFLHGRRSGRGTERLVVVWATGRVDMSKELNDPPPTDTPVNGSLSKIHGLVAVALELTSGRQQLTRSPSVHELWLRPYGDAIDMPVHWLPPASPDCPTRMRVDYREQFRVYAGLPDPTDASHLTIDYAIDNVPGTVDAYLDDQGTVRLTPRQGVVAGLRWYPHAK